MTDTLEYHWYLVVGRSVEGNHNKPFGMERKRITNSDLQGFKDEITKQATEAGFLCSHLVITGIHYLGEMTDEEFKQ